MSTSFLSPGVLFGAFFLASTLGLLLSVVGYWLFGPRGFWIVCASFAIVVVHLVIRAIEAMPIAVGDSSDES